MNKQTGIIYRCYSPSGKSYIGQTTKSLKERIKHHLSNSKNDLSNSRFCQAIRKYGDKLIWEIVHSDIPIDDLDRLEMLEIENYDSYNNGYNSTIGGCDGGFRGKKHSNKTKKILSDIRNGDLNPMFGATGSKNPFYGKKHSLETREKLSINGNSKKLSILCDKCSTRFERVKYRHDKLLKKYNGSYCKTCCWKIGRTSKEDRNTMLSSNCSYCNTDFTTTMINKNKKFCSKECQINGGMKTSRNINSSSLCKVCKKEFNHYSEESYCSMECLYQENDLSYINSDDFIFNALLDSCLKTKSKIVKKGWGLEVHIVNNNEYCLKYLFFLKGKKFSYHYHNLKQELWHCIHGGFTCKLSNNRITSEIEFFVGNKIEIMPRIVHQLTAITDSVIVEVSTRDYKEDSYRIEKGD